MNKTELVAAIADKTELSKKWILCLLHSDGRWCTVSGVDDRLVGKYE